MRGQNVERRVLAVALLGTLLLWALSLGSGVAASPHRINQTIPTFTPTGQASPAPQPTTPGPRPPQVTPGETVPATTVPPAPSATATLLPGETAPAATATQIPGGTEPAGSSPTPSPSPLPAGTSQPGEPVGESTVSPAQPSAGPAMLGSPGPVGELPSLPASQAPDQDEPTPAAGGEAEAAENVLLSPPCMWLSLGLILMAMGVALLLGRRRRQRGGR